MLSFEKNIWILIEISFNFALEGSINIEVSIDLGNGLVSSGNKPLSESVSTKVYGIARGQWDK